jgi:uncharacterized protein YndB with AHSA1/START domain
VSHDLHIERVIDAEPAEVFTTFVDADAMRHWYLDGPDWVVEVEACDVRVGGTTIVSFGPGSERYREEMTYTEVDRPRRLAYDERFTMPDESSFDTVVTVTFDEQDGKTLLTIIQTGFPTAAERDAHQGGWPGFLDRLERVIADAA